MQIFWGRRRPRGTDMDIIRAKNKLSKDLPTQQYFMIPAALVFWGCPIVPAHVSGHLYLFPLGKGLIPWRITASRSCNKAC
jgi:hypothetical protein